MAEVVGSDRMARRRSRAREALMRAGETLFARQAVEAVSIDDIVAAADVAKGSFYNHFEDREALARAIAAQVRTGIEATVTELNGGVADPAERVARALCIFVRLALSNPDRARAMLRLFADAAVPDSPMNRGVRTDLEAGLAAGRFVETTVETGVLMALGLVRIAVSRVLEPGAHVSSATVAQDLAAGLLRALGLEIKAAQTLAARAADDVFALRLVLPGGPRGEVQTELS